MMENVDREQFVELSRFDRLISNLAASMSATIINTLIIGAVLWNVAVRERLLVWCAANVAYALCRYIIIYYYKKKFNKDHLAAWRIGTFVSFAIAGLLFGSSGIFLVDPSKFEYVIFLYFVAGGMVVGSAGSYHNELPIYFVYSITVFMLPTVELYFMGKGISSPMVALGVVFYALVTVMAVRLNRDLRESLLLRYDNDQLVRSLEEAKSQTERLNAALMEKNVELKELALADPLTSLRNRRYLSEVVMPEIETFSRNNRWKREGVDARSLDVRKSYAICLVDIDHFKQVNDNYGHDSGDMVLVQLAGRLRDSVRSEDVVCRYGGEEFVVVLRHVEREKAIKVVKKIHKSVQSIKYAISGGRAIALTCSIGFMFYGLHEGEDAAMTVDRMITMADGALYYAKTHGRNAVVQAIPLELEQGLDYVVL